MNAYNVHQRIIDLNKRIKKLSILEKESYEMETKKMYGNIIDDYTFEIKKLNEYLINCKLESEDELKILLKVN